MKHWIWKFRLAIIIWRYKYLCRGWKNAWEFAQSDCWDESFKDGMSPIETIREDASYL